MTLDAVQPSAGPGVRLDVLADGDEPARLRELRSWLVASGDLGGRVDLVETQSDPEALGGLADALTVSLAAGGTTTVLAQAVVAWVRSRTSRVQVTMQRGIRTVSVDAVAVSGLDAAAVVTLVHRLSRDLEQGADG